MNEREFWLEGNRKRKSWREEREMDCNWWWLVEKSTESYGRVWKICWQRSVRSAFV